MRVSHVLGRAERCSTERDGEYGPVGEGQGGAHGAAAHAGPYPLLSPEALCSLVGLVLRRLPPAGVDGVGRGGRGAAFGSQGSLVLVAGSGPGEDLVLAWYSGASDSVEASFTWPGEAGP